MTHPRRLGARTRSVLARHGMRLTPLFAVAVFAAMVAYADLDAVVGAFGQFDWWVALVVLACSSAGYLFRFWKWHRYFGDLEVELPLGTSLIAFFSGLMMVVTPGKAGEFWKAWFLRDSADVPVGETAAVVGAERVTDLLALSLLGLCGLVVFGRSSTVLVAALVVFLVVIAVLQWRSFCLAVLDRAGDLPAFGNRISDVRDFYENAYVLFRLKPLAIATALSVVAWGLEGVALWLVLEAFGVESGVVVGLFVFGLGSVLGAVSMLPGGLLAAEASMVGLLVTFGYARSVAVGATMVIRVGTLWYAAALGTLVFTAYSIRTNGMPASIRLR